jgi:uncharacterized membrane protein/tRNA A-37 threonylcarbamoyl transferase component Bud32
MNTTPSKPVESPTQDSANPETIGCPTPAPPGDGATPQRIGDFTIVRVLGEGGMGTVYLAEDVRLGRKAAIKTMKPELAAKPENRLRFVREARAAAAVEHDNIVPIWQVGESADGSPFIAMPFLQGEMLEARLKREPIQPPGIILKVAREVAEGLAAAHACGLIHRDIKPGNIWIEGDPESRDLAGQARRCKILDFGLARSVGTEDVQITASGMILGTPAYMAPEQASGETVDYRADLFSLGVMLYRMSTGRMPFAGPNMMAVLNALATTTPPPAQTLNRKLPQALSDLIARLMNKDPAGRPHSAAEVATAVRQIETPAKPRRGRTPLLAALGLLVLMPLVWWLATVILRVETANGTLIVEINDAETEARIKNGKLILTGPDEKVLYTLSPGERDKKIDAGPYKIRVEGADGLTLDTSEFTLKKGGKVTVRVTAEPRVVARNFSPDRKAAEWVLSIGGVLRVEGQDRVIKAAADLPPEVFRLTEVGLSENKKVSDAGLTHFKDCKNLTSLHLWDTRVGDAGLSCFKDCKSLRVLVLGRTQVSDAGLAHFKDCKNLTHLNLGYTRVSDAGLALFKDCKNLTILWLYHTKVSDAGLAPFRDCKDLIELNLTGTKVRGAGLAHFKDCKNLIALDLCDTKVGDEGLAYFKDCKKLTLFRVTGQQVSDAGLAHFKGCKRLTHLNLSDTRVSDAGLALFKDCKNLTILWLYHTKVSDAGLAPFRDCKDLIELNLAGTEVSDTGLDHFKDCKNLALLYLDDTRVSDTGLAHFKDCKNLTQLGLHGTQVSDAGLAYFKDCKNLTRLWLHQTQVTRAKIEELKKALPRCRIVWDDGVIEPRAK